MINQLQQPLLWIPALGILLCIVTGVAAFKARGGLKRAALGSIAALCVLAPAYLLAAVFKPHWIDARHRTYQSFYDAIETGMTRFEVLARLDEYYPADGARKRPRITKDTTDELGLFMNPEHSYEPNCEGIFLDFADGKVTRKRYSRD
jgi:hypothetical protein